MKFPCLVKLEDTGEHAIMFADKSVLMIEGNDAGKITKCKFENITEPTVFRFQTYSLDDFNVINNAFKNAVTNFRLNAIALIESDECLHVNFSITDAIYNHHSQLTTKSPEPELTWHTEHEVKNSFNQFVPVDIFVENEKKVWFRYRPAECTPVQQPASPAAVLHDVHTETLCSINKSSKHYRVIKKADVTMSECLTQIVTDGPVNATLIITE